MAMTNTPDKSEMLPCPFCGNDASVSDGSNGLHFRVICNKSACRAAGPLERCAVDAKDAWNTRASSRHADQVQDMVERLGETLHDLSDSLRQIGFFSGERKHIARYEAVVSAFENLAALQAVPAASGGVEETERLRDILDTERYKVAIGVQAIARAIQGRRWLSEPGCGSYAWDDERYQQEFGAALDEIEAALKPLRAIAQNWSDCPRDPLRVVANRDAALKASGEE